MTEPTREVLWNIDHAWLMYVLLVPTLAVSGYGFYRRIQTWRVGRPLGRFDRPRQRIGRLFRHALLQQKTLRERYAGLFHAMIFWGFLTLLAATTVVMLDHDFRLPIMRGSFYLYFQSFFVDLLGLLFVVGIALAGFRRFILRPKPLVYTSEAAMILLALFLLGVTGFLLEGWRIAATEDPWGSWSPVGSLVAKVSAPLGEETLRFLHRGTWWFHLVLTFGFLAWIPYTKMAHTLFAPLNIYTALLEPTGASLKPIDFETSETFGVQQLNQFTWKDLLDLDACTECGRCTASCPAHATGKPLSPRDIILDLRSCLHEGRSAEPLVGLKPALSAEALWSCTTCAACVEACPVSIEQLPKIIDMRRHRVMDEADFPEMMQGALDSIETRGHPFRGTPATRVDWTDGLDIAEWSEGETYDVLYWVGCSGALVERNQRSVRATAQLLKKAGVRFAILGRNEKCTGDLARRIGNEFLFESVAKENIELLQARATKRIVTSCPHCFNTIANEYPRLGGDFQVSHHTEYLAELVREGKLKPTHSLAETVTFHDPCYLGRHNGVYDAPRELVQISIGKAPVEMPRSRSSSFCCGGGGGMSFIDEAKDQRVSHRRAEEAAQMKTDTLAVGCPFCATMLEDAVKATAGADGPRVKDVAELLWQAVNENGEGETNGSQSVRV